MNQNNRYNFIIIDDSKLDCFIAEKIIKNAEFCASIRSFLQAQEALDFIKNTPNEQESNTILLIDIQMPVMNGFEFVEEFEKFDEQIRKKYKLFIISSSINDNDITRVQNYPSLIQFVNKPLTIGNLGGIIQNIYNAN